MSTPLAPAAWRARYRDADGNEIWSGAVFPNEWRAQRWCERFADLEPRLVPLYDAQSVEPRLREAWAAACAYIDESPCDPDITGDQWRAWQRFVAARQALEGT